MQQMQDVPTNTPNTSNTPLFEDVPQMQDTPAASFRITGWRKVCACVCAGVCVLLCVCVCVACRLLAEGTLNKGLGFRLA